MNILIACDKFRGSLTGQEVASFLKEGIKSGFPGVICQTMDLADGGEGTMELLAKTHQATQVGIVVPNAIGKNRKKRFYFNPQSKTAILEMAEYVGLAELSESERNPMKTTSEGLGVAISKVMTYGAEKIILGIGGSATNDGGAGVLFGLGFKFLASDGKEVIPSGGNLAQIEKIIPPDLSDFRDVELIIASDVDNPLCGAEGAVYTYALQKGAPKEDLEILEGNLRHYGEIIQGLTGNKVFELPSYGAAGGVALSLCECLGAKLRSGSELIFEVSGMEAKIHWADVIITGEGKIDDQTAHGKAISPIVNCALKESKKLFLVCGIFQETNSEILKQQPRFELVEMARELGLDSFQDARKLVEEAGSRIATQLSK